MTLSNYDSWLCPPDPKVGASGDMVFYVMRPNPLCEESPDDLELEVALTFDEGYVFSAHLTEGGWPIELTAKEQARAEQEWADRVAEEPDEPDWDMDR